MQKERIKLLIVCGPTASGKTGLGARLAQSLFGEVVSADSMQIYKGIPIASAQPKDEEMLGVPHHLIGFLDVGEPFSLSEYLRLAHQKIAEIASRGKLPILVGGTGLYIDSLADDVNLSEVGNTDIRDRLKKEAEEKGTHTLYERLSKIDPAYSEKIEMGDARRIIRALEVYEVSGFPISRHNELSKSKPSRYETLRIFLNFSDRSLLYERINKRVDEMVKEGLRKEAEKMRDSCSLSGAGQAIGHKELYPYLSGEISLEEAIENLKRATRRYAKRQITWFNKREDNNLILADKEDAYLRAMEIIKGSDFR